MAAGAGTCSGCPINGPVSGCKSAPIELLNKSRYRQKKIGKLTCWQCYIAGLWRNAIQLSE
jgi:hypothetical protein